MSRAGHWVFVYARLWGEETGNKEELLTKFVLLFGKTCLHRLWWSEYSPQNTFSMKLSPGQLT